MFDESELESDVAWSSGTISTEELQPIEFEELSKFTVEIHNRSGDGTASLCCSECGEAVGCVNDNSFTCGCEDEPERWDLQNEDDIDRSGGTDELSFRDDIDYEP
jgi:hypothetical protein